MPQLRILTKRRVSPARTLGEHDVTEHLIAGFCTRPAPGRAASLERSEMFTGIWC